MSQTNQLHRRLIIFILILVPLLVPTSAISAGASPVLIGLDTNPPPSEPYSPVTVRKWFKIGVDAGMTTVSLSPIWRDVEKTPGHYELSGLESQSQLASDYGLLIRFLAFDILPFNSLRFHFHPMFMRVSSKWLLGAEGN